jgi:maltose phosphorylase
MDLDDYNRNTSEGLHTTSIAAAWMNIVYGFGGFRSDGDMVVLAPTIPSYWTSYTFHLTINRSILTVFVTAKDVTLSVEGDPVSLLLFGNDITIHTTHTHQLVN